MAYNPTNWKDRVVEKPRTFTMQDNGDGTITLIPAPGTILEPGTPVNATNLNKLEQGLKSHEADNAKHGMKMSGIWTDISTVIQSSKEYKKTIEIGYEGFRASIVALGFNSYGMHGEIRDGEFIRFVPRYIVSSDSGTRLLIGSSESNFGNMFSENIGGTGIGLKNAELIGTTLTLTFKNYTAEARTLTVNKLYWEVYYH